jgi:ribosomal protein S18 acetylase RimI-like enzyme
MTIEAHYSVTPLVSSSGQTFDEFYRIYLESISTRERKPKIQISAIVLRSDYQVLLLNKNDVIAGFSILFTPPNESFCLLEYMAVDSAYRNLGLGKTLFFQSLQTVFKKQGIVPCLLEVDSDRERAADQETRRKRQRFYRSLGCLRIERLSYVLPLQGEGSPPEMDLFIYYPGLIPKIGKRALEHWLKVIYSKVYECSPDDSRIAPMLEVVGDPLILI